MQINFKLSMVVIVIHICITCLKNFPLYDFCTLLLDWGFIRPWIN